MKNQNKSNWHEFFQGTKGRFSMGRLLPFICFFPSTGAMLWLHTTEALTAYMSVFALHSFGSKWLDVKGNTKTTTNEG